MAQTTAPLMSFRARGQVGKTLVFAKWKGIPYARQYVVPSNPKTAQQTQQRGLFSWVHDCYKWLPAEATAAWAAYAKGTNMTPANAWQQKNIGALVASRKPLVLKPNNDTLIFAPAVLGGPSLGAANVVAGATKLTVSVTAPVLPTGWVQTGFLAICTPQITTFVETEPVKIFSQSAAPPAVTADITGLATGTVYVASAIMWWTRADGKIAYNAATSATGTPT